MRSGFAANLQTNSLCSMGAFLVSASLVVIGLLLQANTHLNHDLSWILYSAQEMVHGAVFGRDIIAPNPPLAWYLTLPAVLLSEAWGFHPATAFRAWFSALTFCLLVFSYRIFQRRSMDSGWLSDAFFIILTSYYLFIGCYRDFAQREYLALVMSLPYILLASGHMEGTKCSRSVAIAAGLLAGIGLALKPYFLVVPLFVELTGILKTRSLRFSLRLEVWLLSAFIGLYIVAVFILVPDYLFSVVPLVQPIYWAFNNELLSVGSQIVPEIIAYVMVLCLAARQPRSPLIDVLLAAGAGFLVSYFVQMKGYTYHGFPFRVIVALMLGLIIAKSIQQRAGPDTGLPIQRIGLTGIALLLILTFNLISVSRWYDSSNESGGVYAAVTQQLIDLVDRYAGDGYFLALSTHPFPAFPVAIYAEAKSASSMNSRFFLPAVAKLRKSGANADPDGLRFAENQARKFLLRDLSMEPRLILVSNGSWKHGIGDIDFDILKFYLEDPTARALWRDYRELEPVSEFRVFVREEQGGAS